ncbi:MAG: CBS domain-containing protein [archaeon]
MEVSVLENPLIEEIKRFISLTPPFDLLDDSDLFMLASSVRVSYHPRGETIFSATTTEPPRMLFIVFRGAVRLTDPKTPEGFEILMNGDILRPISSCLGVPFRPNAESEEDTILYEIPEELFEKLFEKNREFQRFFLACLSSRFAKTSTVRLEKPSAYCLAVTTVKDLSMKEPVTIDAENTIQEAVMKMSGKGISSVIVLKDDKPVGIITDTNVKRAVSQGFNPNAKASEHMSSPVQSVDTDSNCLEAFSQMLRHSIKHLAVLEGGKLRGVITLQDLMFLEFCNPYYVMLDIDMATSLEQLAQVKARTEGLARQLLNRALDFQHISSFFTLITDRLILRTILMAISKVGGSSKFSLIGFGSLGREELTVEPILNFGIIYDDDIDEVEKRRITEIGRLSSEMLQEIGYSTNRWASLPNDLNWCKSSSKWEEFFVSSVEKNANKFSSELLDFRPIYGEEKYVETLRKRIISMFS